MPASIQRQQAAACDLRQIACICAGLAVLVFLVFGQTARFTFVDYDDNFYVYENPDVLSGLTFEGIARAFTHKVAGLWNPLVMISHMLDCQLYGTWAGGHHLTNMLLHLVSTILLFLILRGMTGALWRSAFVAAIFAIHPLQVESVVWISERKDVLSGVFFMLTVGAYLRYTLHPGRGRYLWVMLLFACGLMCKPMLVTLPLLLLVLDYWPLRRSVNWRLLIEKIPLLLMSLTAGVATVFDHKDPTGINVYFIPFWSRIAEAPVWIAVYLRQMVWPANLTLIYTHHEWSLPWWPAAVALLAFITTGVCLARKKYPYLLAGWLWNLVALAPVSGVLQISRHQHADHYNYLAQTGLYIALTWWAVDSVEKMRHGRVMLKGAALAILCALSIAAWWQTGYWHDEMALWTHDIQCTQDNIIAHENLGVVFLRTGEPEKAKEQYQAALRIGPSDVEALDNLATGLAQLGRASEAIALDEKAIKLQPDNAYVQNNLAWLLATAPDKSLRNASMAVQLATQASQETNEKNPSILDTLAAAYAETGDFSKAAQTAEQALELAKEQSNAALIQALPREISLYKSNHPYEAAR